MKRLSLSLAACLLLGSCSGEGAPEEAPRPSDRASPSPTAPSSPSKAAPPDYSGQDLRGADFAGAALRGANFQGAILADADFEGATLLGANFQGADLSGANLRDADLRGGASLEGANLARADLQGAALRGANLRSAILVEADLTDADLAGAELTDASLTGSTLDGAGLEDTTGLTDAMIADALGVKVADLAGALAARDVRFESREEILEALAPVCRRGAPVPEASPYSGGGQFHPTVILATDRTDFPPIEAEPNEWTDQAARLGWEPVSVPFAHLVACAEHLKSVRLESCGLYASGIGGGASEQFLWQERWRVSVIAARDGAVVGESIIKGRRPTSCPAVIGGQFGTSEISPPVEFPAVSRFLSPLVGQPPPD